jgi:hypothetical protein
MVYHQRQPGLHPSNFMENNTQVDMVYHQHVTELIQLAVLLSARRGPQWTKQKKNTYLLTSLLIVSIVQMIYPRIGRLENELSYNPLLQNSLKHVGH